MNSFYLVSGKKIRKTSKGTALEIKVSVICQKVIWGTNITLKIIVMDGGRI